MAKITFIILAHENADHVADLANLLTEWDPHANAVIHYDLNAPAKQYERLKARVADSKKIFLVKDRLKCGWGNFSLVDAVVRSLRVIRREKLDCDRVMLISGACMPIRPLKELSDFLDAHPKTEFIEAYDSNWMIGGLRKERYQYWHFFNHQTHQKLFNWHFQLQRMFWPKRRFPRALEPRFGSQWWCLSWKLCEKILDYIQKHPLTYFFFSTTWIPDELYFQTMAFKFTHIDNLARRNLTFFHFNDWGKPIVLLDDHIEMIKDLPFFFARKVSSSAKKLRAHLIDVAKQPAPAEPVKIDFSKRFVFPYKEMIAELPKASPLTPALFQHRNAGLWSDVLENCPKSFAILYGPPKLVRRASDAIRNVPGLTVLGRVLHPAKVDFGPGVKVFRGLHADDDLIRDFDRPSYFTRILDRIDDLPVIEICPGDDPAGEMALMLSRNAIVLPVMPEHDSDIMRQLYWTLSIGGVGASKAAAAPVQSFRAMEAAIEAIVPADYRLRTEAYLKTANMTAETSADDWQTALRFRHGDAVRPLTDSLGAMEQSVNAISVDEMVADLPDDWRRSVSTLSDLHARWRLLKLNFPVALPELFTSGLELQSNARHIGNSELTEASRGGTVNANQILSIVTNQFSYQLRLRRFGKQLKLTVNRTKEMKKSDVLLFMCLRNELFRLPYFVDYYRKLGVNHFLIIDNDSTDGFQEWAKQQPDVSVWHTKAGYKASNFGMEWCNFLLRKYGTGHLCVTVDPDEFLVYPCMESRNLKELGEYMRMEKREAFHAVMLDAYSDKPLNETIYKSGDNPWDVAPFFDRDGYVQVGTRAMPTFTRGGPRMRVHNRRDPAKSPALNKIPVVWWRWHFRYVSSMHDIKPMRLMRVQDRFNPTPTGALFHFKFFASLKTKAAEEMNRKEHFSGGAEYERYVRENREVLYEDGVSTRYESPEQLIHLGLMCRGNWL